MAYDNYNFFVRSDTLSTERPSDVVLSIAGPAPRGVAAAGFMARYCRIPAACCKARGTQTRSIRLESAKEIAQPAIAALLDAAVAEARTP